MNCVVLRVLLQAVEDTGRSLPQSNTCKIPLSGTGGSVLRRTSNRAPRNLDWDPGKALDAPSAVSPGIVGERAGRTLQMPTAGEAKPLDFKPTTTTTTTTTTARRLAHQQLLATSTIVVTSRGEGACRPPPRLCYSCRAPSTPLSLSRERVGVPHVLRILKPCL